MAVTTSQPTRHSCDAHHAAGASRHQIARAATGVKSFTDADLDRVLTVVKANPGKQPSQIQAASGLRENVFAAATKWLKTNGKLRVVGKARGTSYTVV